MKNDLENENDKKKIKSYTTTGSNSRPSRSGLPLSYAASRWERCKAAI